MTTSLSSADIYLDAQGLSQLRRSAGANSDEALKAVAEQFEALFIQQMLKTMRDAKLAEGLFDNDQSELYIDLYDKQLAITLSKANGLGLSDMIVEQLNRQMPGENGKDKKADTASGIERSGSIVSNVVSDSVNAPSVAMPSSQAQGSSTHSIHPTAAQNSNNTPFVNANPMPNQVAKLADYSQLLNGANRAPINAKQKIEIREGLAQDTMLKSAYRGNSNANVNVNADLHSKREVMATAVTMASPKLSGVALNVENDQQRHSSMDDLATPFSTPESFVKTLWPFAQKAAQQLGVTPKVLLAQAALETGWGKAINKHTDGRSSHNLFNIKANNAWSGDSVVVSTLEYDDGLARREKALFRSYQSFQESFDDYVALIKQSPRYQSALAKAADSQAYAQELQQAGYATDPDYSHKIIKIINGAPMEKAIDELKLSFNETISAMSRSGK